jgi:hypothetical protein
MSSACLTVFTIPELAHQIFDHLLTFEPNVLDWPRIDPAARRDLTNAAVVSRAFTPSALDVSWQQLDSLLPLRALLDVECSISTHGQHRISQCAVGSSRLQCYLRRVRRLIINLKARTMAIDDMHTLRRLRASIPSGPLFPNLTDAFVLIGGSQTAAVCVSALYRIVHESPSLSGL